MDAELRRDGLLEPLVPSSPVGLFWLPQQDFSASALLTFWARYFLVVRTVLCIVGYLAVSLASTYKMLVAFSRHIVATKNISGHCQMPWGWGQK